MSHLGIQRQGEGDRIGSIRCVFCYGRSPSSGCHQRHQGPIYVERLRKRWHAEGFQFSEVCHPFCTVPYQSQQQARFSWGIARCDTVKQMCGGIKVTHFGGRERLHRISLCRAAAPAHRTVGVCLVCLTWNKSASQGKQATSNAGTKQQRPSSNQAWVYVLGKIKMTCTQQRTGKTRWTRKSACPSSKNFSLALYSATAFAPAGK